MTRFSKWIEHAEITDDPAGDLIGDLKTANRSAPLPIRGPRTLIGFLERNGACRAAIDVAPKVWERFKASPAAGRLFSIEYDGEGRERARFYRTPRAEQ